MSLYSGVASRGFRRYATYRSATLAGIFTNTVFGVIISYTYIALWDQRPQLGGYGVEQALMFCWIAQALIMPVGLFGGGIIADYSERVRSGAVATDLQRPVPLLAVRLAEDLGRGAYHLLTRGVAPLVLGALFFPLAWPSTGLTWILFAVSVTLAMVIGFALRYLLGLLAFWIIDTSGPASMLIVAQIFASGSALPLVTFPDRLRTVCELLPFRCLVQVPCDVLLRDDTGTAALPLLGLQVLWAGLLLGLGAVLTRTAVRKVVVQGG
ncbi:MAG: ABC-2 family transporter protein [Actinomycetota bacterium]|nr:ABC-2 family transporter protein [Actinomycetota bacterium]